MNCIISELTLAWDFTSHYILLIRGNSNFLRLWPETTRCNSTSISDSHFHPTRLKPCWQYLEVFLIPHHPPPLEQKQLEIKGVSVYIQSGDQVIEFLHPRGSFITFYLSLISVFVSRGTLAFYLSGNGKCLAGCITWWTEQNTSAILWLYHLISLTLL